MDATKKADSAKKPQRRTFPVVNGCIVPRLCLAEPVKAAKVIVFLKYLSQRADKKTKRSCLEQQVCEWMGEL